jgi:hypothetical protein
MMQGNCSEHQYLAALRFAREDYKEETKQSHMIDFLEKSLDHYLPSRVHPFSPEQVSARVEGFFRRYKTLTGHEVLPLLTIAKGIRLLAHAAIVRRVRDIEILLPVEVMSEDDQRETGSFARAILIAEIEVANQTLVTQSLTGDLLCSCDARGKYGLPCSHYINMRLDRRPMLSLEDIPPRGRRQHISQEGVASHTVTRMPSDGRLPDDEYSFANLSARFEPYLSAATRDPRLQQGIDDCLRRCEARRTQMSQPSTGGGGTSAVPVLDDPLILPIAGGHNVHRSRRSPLAHPIGLCHKKLGKPKKRILRSCSLCKQTHDNAQTY